MLVNPIAHYLQPFWGESLSIKKQHLFISINNINWRPQSEARSAKVTPKASLHQRVCLPSLLICSPDCLYLYDCCLRWQKTKCVYIERSLSFTGLILQINLCTMPMCCSRLCLLLLSLSPAVTQACSPGHTHWLLLEMRDFPIYTVCVCVCVLFLKSVPPGHLILFYDSPPRFVLPLKSLLYCTDDSII